VPRQTITAHAPAHRPAEGLPGKSCLSVGAAANSCSSADRADHDLANVLAHSPEKIPPPQPSPPYDVTRKYMPRKTILGSKLRAVRSQPQPSPPPPPPPSSWIQRMIATAPVWAEVQVCVHILVLCLSLHTFNSTAVARGRLMHAAYPHTGCLHLLGFPAWGAVLKKLPVSCCPAQACTAPMAAHVHWPHKHAVTVMRFHVKSNCQLQCLHCHRWVVSQARQSACASWWCCQSAAPLLQSAADLCWHPGA